MPRVLFKNVTATSRRKGSLQSPSCTRPKDVAFNGGKGMQEIFSAAGLGKKRENLGVYLAGLPLSGVCVGVGVPDRTNDCPSSGCVWDFVGGVDN